jgi:hydroxymethylpyrimidine/phosphomethylpyrimidine kinase
VLAIAGVDPSGRAGLFADLETIRARGAVPLGVPTALTAQGTKRFGVFSVPSVALRAELRALLELGRVDAVKLGMVPDPETLRLLRRELHSARAKWVVDPVVMTSRGQRLSSLRPRDYLALTGAILTPNLDECRWLVGSRSKPWGVEEAARAAESLVDLGLAGVVVKGGHLLGPTAIDVVCTARGVELVRAPRLERALSKRGTGCRHASALAVAVANGASLLQAARQAQAAVGRYLKA